MDQPLEELKVFVNALCYKKSLTTQYASYSDLSMANTDVEAYITSSFPI